MQPKEVVRGRDMISARRVLANQQAFICSGEIKGLAIQVTLPPGSILTMVTVLIDAGLLIGTGYGVTPSSQSWSARVSSITAPGAYQYQCTVHDWMQGTINVKSHSGDH